MEGFISIKKLKGLLIAYNVYFWFSGPGVLGLSCWFYLSVREFEPSVQTTKMSVAAFILMSAGAAIIFIGIMGCIGIFNANNCLLGLYMFSLLLVFSVEFAACIHIFVFYDECLRILIVNDNDKNCGDFVESKKKAMTLIESQVSKGLNHSLCHLYLVSDDITSSMDALQRQLKCCGINEYQDWKQFKYMHLSEEYIVETSYLPLSCCGDLTGSTSNVKGWNGTCLINNKGCSPVLQGMLKQNIILFGWISFGLALLQPLGFALACCLRKAVNDLYR